MFTRVLAVVSMGILSILLFKWAAGSLSIRRLNIISISFYLYFVLVYLGASAIFLGMADDYYMVWKLTDGSIEHGFWLIAIAGILLPLTIGTIEKLFGKREDLRVQYDRYCSSSVVQKIDERKIRTAITLFLAICVFSTVYTFFSIGSIPLLEVLLGGNENAVAMRAEAKSGFGGLVQIRNLGMLQLAPALSLLCQICYRTMTPQKWKNVFIFSFVLTCVVLTYNLEKAPIVFYLFEAFVLELLLGRQFTKRQITAVVVSLVGVLLLMYLFTAGSETLVFSLTAGPIGRALLAYPAAFMLHVQAFPDQLQFLNGAGLPSFVEQLVGANADMGRSAVAVMTMYNTQQSTVGLAYAMNTFFPAEAYANWGYAGYLFSIIWVGALLGLLHTTILRKQKTQLNLFIYIIVLRFQVQVMLGGFIDYLFSVNLIFSIATIIFIGLLSKQQLAKRKGDTSYRKAKVASGKEGEAPARSLS